MCVRFAVGMPNFVPEEHGGPGTIQRFVSWATAAEAAGWDGFFIWDHVVFVKDWPLHVENPWVLLAAMACATERIRLGTAVTPLPRRRPWQVAREAVSLDHLSNGRLVLGVGLGAPVESDFVPFGEPGDNRILGQRLDEALDVISGLWSGELFSYAGRQYQLDNVRFLPRPVQSPRIPIWVAGVWPNKAPMRRAARWDGVCPLKTGSGEEPYARVTPDDLRAIRAYIAEHRVSDAPFDTVIGGVVPGDDPARALEIVTPYAEAGLTWWVEAFDWFGPSTPESFLERIHQGPPRT